MFATHAIARALTAGLKPDAAPRHHRCFSAGSEHGDRVTPAELDAPNADTKATVAPRHTRPVRWIVATGAAVTATIPFSAR